MLDVMAPQAWALPQGPVDAYHRENMCAGRYNDYTAFKRLLGVPSHKADLAICADTDFLSLWELWKGKNPVVTQIVNENFLANGGWMLYLYPHQDFEGKKYTAKSYVFESEVMQSMADQGVNPLLQVHVEEEEFTVDFKGLSFEMPANFVFSPDGITSFSEQIKALEESLDQTCQYEISGQTIRAGQKQFLDALPPKPWTEQQLIDQLRNDAIEWGSLQKGQAKNTEANGVQLLVDQYVTPTEVIFPMAKALTFVRQADRRHTTFAKGGPETADKGIDSDRNVLISSATEYGLRIRSARACKLHSGKLHNPFVTYSVLGEFYAGDDLTMRLTGNRRQYTTEDRSITLGDAQNTKRDISLREMVDNCGIWNVTVDPKGVANGKVTERGHDILSICASWSPNDDSSVSHKRLFAGASIAKYPSIRDVYNRLGWDNVLQLRERQSRTEPEAGGSTAALPTMSVNDAEKKAQKAQSVEEMLNHPISDYLAIVNLINNGLPVPINFLIFRPRIVFETGAVVVMRGGADTGKLLLTEVQVNFERRPMTRMIAVHLNFSARTVITKQQRKNIALFRNAYVVKLVEGYGTNWVKGNDSVAAHARGRPRGDLYSIACPGNFTYNKMFLDKTGQVSSRLLERVGLNRPPQYPTAREYTRMYQWPTEGTDDYTLQELINPSVHGHSLMVRGAYRLHTPLEAGLGDNGTNDVFGKSPLGERIGDQLWNVIAGKPTTLEDNVQRLS